MAVDVTTDPGSVVGEEEEGGWAEEEAGWAEGGSTTDLGTVEEEEEEGGWAEEEAGWGKERGEGSGTSGLGKPGHGLGKFCNISRLGMASAT